MIEHIHVLTTKEDISRIDQDGTIVVMDVLLATTTILTALEHGAQSVHIAETVDDALALANTLAPPVVLGGEQGGEPIPHFHLGQDPMQYTPQAIANKQVVYVSTNGTRAMALALRTENPVLLACLRNAPATAQFLSHQANSRIYLACAGSRGALSLEDFICAGTIARLLPPLPAGGYNDAALVAMEVAQAKSASQWVSAGRVGRWLTQLGWSQTLEYAARVGASALVMGLSGSEIIPLGPSHPA